MNILLEIAFLGTAYGGWQVQRNTPTVQGTLQDAVENVYGARLPVTGCSRTDSGVHAKLFCAMIGMDGAKNSVPLEKIPIALGAHLPEDISVLRAKEVPCDFHPRYSAKGKEYKYLIYCGRTRDPFLSGRALFRPKPLKLELMNAAAQCFVGEHDFTSFMAAGSKITDPVREIYSAKVEREGELITFTVSGNGFLYNMVRIMVGTLMYVSDNDLPPEHITAVIEARDRHAAGITVPAHGLYLNRVFY